MSDRIPQTWEHLRASGRKALIPYVTPDYPVEDSTVDLVLTLESAGASFMEIGIPFSDPLADGPVIQHASQVALRNGATPMRVLEIVHKIRKQSQIPILLMGYINPLLRIGVDRYLELAAEAGVDGLIIPDLPPQESSSVHASADHHGLSMVYLLAPTTSEQRMKMIDSLSTHFTYCVSMTGVTGSSKRFDGEGSLGAFLERVRACTTKPCVVGFGITTQADVERVWQYADGAVVGSQLLREIAASTSVGEVVRNARTYLERLYPLS